MKKNTNRFTALMMSTVLLTGAISAGSTAVSFGATEHWNDASQEAAEWTKWKENWDNYSSNYENVSMTPGVDETQLNYAWYSHTKETPAVRISTKEDMSDAKEFTGNQETAVTLYGVQYYASKVTVKDLKAKTQYYYQVYQNGKWQDAEGYSTKSFNSFSFLYVGDPQIGASKKQVSQEGETMSSSKSLESKAEENLGARNDSYNWNNVLKSAYALHPEVSFIASAGDQVNYAQNEREYAGYLGAEALAQLPVATTIGNHDSGSNQYSLHYNNPNAFSETEIDYTEGKTAAGTDYYYTYGNVLFIVLDTNNYNCATHKNVIDKAVKENPDTKWRVVMFHQDIYGSGLDHSDSDGMVLRTQLTPIMDEYDIDVVLQGHDHTYSRTYQLEGDGKEHAAYDKTNWEEDANFITQNNCYDIVSKKQSGTITNPKGTVYLEANSATGSKFYNLITAQQDYIAERSQTWTPSYSVIKVTDTTFSVTAYDADTGKELEGSSTYTIVKKPAITGKASYSKKVGAKSFKLDAKATDGRKLTYKSSNSKVATVSAKGKVTIKGAGKATITVKTKTAKGKKTLTKKITIKVKAK